jgi:hypothetical protein
MRDNGVLFARSRLTALPSTSIPIATAVAPPGSTTMLPQERRSAVSLAMIFALRMLGLFLVLPVVSKSMTAMRVMVPQSPRD